LALTVGTRLGVYEVSALIGEGGMGQVYRARDTKLGRDVALKSLPDIFATDPDRMARFTREAQTLAALNHPNIAHIYGLEESGGLRALVMELVDGEDLAQRLARGAVPIEEAVPIARQIVEALEAAHERGIIHRDLKPANIKVRDDGTVKILDFGLAKALDTTSTPSSSAAQSPTITTPAMMTGVGVLLGTAAYMSPEQARGRAADKRSDVWAFGCVLFEMLTGKRAFDGEDVSDTLANVLKSEPEWSVLPGSVPEHIRLIMRWCLAKDRGNRMPDVSVARFLLTETVMGSAGAAPAPRPRPRWRRAIPVATTAIVVALVTAVLVWRSVWRPTAAPVVRFPIVLPAGLQFAGRSQVVAVSADGLRVVYAGGNRQSPNEPRQRAQLYVRSLAEMEAHPIVGTSLDVMSPFFSPDGQWVGFYSFQDSTLKKVRISGGVPQTICKADPPYGVTWDGDWIVYADQGSRGILRVSSDGGEPEVLVAVKRDEVFGAPQMLDGGTAILFTVAPVQGVDRWDRAQIVTQAVGSTHRTVIVRGGSEGRYVPSGHLVYMVGTTLFAVPVDPRTLQVRGGSVPIVQGLRRFRANIGAPAASFAFSSTGSLVYILDSSPPPAQRTLALASRDGKLHPLDLPPQPYFYPRVSPDGNELAVETDDGNDAIIWTYNLKRGGPASRLTFGGRNAYPVWTPDGRSVTFQSDRDGDRGIFSQRADGTRPAERLSTPEPLAQHFPEAWTPDGKTLVFAATPPFDDRLFTLSSDGAAPKAWSAALPAHHAAFSPDGNWMAYASTEIGNRHEVFVQPFPPTGEKHQISTEGATTPLWSLDQTQLYYWANLAQHLVAVDVRTRPTFSAGKSVVLPIQAIFTPSINFERNYDLLPPDGKQFVVVTPAAAPSRDSDAAPATRINVVLNWFEELKALVPTK